MAADKSLKDLASGVGVMAENSPKIQKDVEKIREAVCGGSDSMLSAMIMMSTVAQNIDRRQARQALRNSLSSNSDEKRRKNIFKSTSGITDLLKKILEQLKTNEKVFSKFGGKGGNLESHDLSRRDMREKQDKLGNISKALDVIDRLKRISIKDLIFANKKIKSMMKVMEKSLNMFRMFKNNKEAEHTVAFADKASDTMKKLGKGYMFAKLAEKSVKSIEKIYLGTKGKGGLLRLFRKLHKNRKEIKKGEKYAAQMLAATGMLLLTAMLLTGIAVIGPAALLGALITAGVIVILLGTFKMMSKGVGDFLKGSLAFLAMSVGLIAFSLGFAMLRKATQELTWKEVGIMAAVVGGLAAIVGLAGLAGAYIISGALGIASIGVGLLAFSLGILLYRKATKDMTWKDVGIMTAVIGGTGIAFALVGLASPFVLLGSIALTVMSVSLGVFGLVLWAWSKIDTKQAMTNIDTAVNGLRTTFGLEFGKAPEGKSFGSRLGTSLEDLAISVLNFGEAFFVMGAILMAGVALGALYIGLHKWDNFNGQKAMGNIKTAISGLKEAFGIQDEKPKGFWGSVGNLASAPFKAAAAPFELVNTILKGGQVLAEMATIVIATIAMDIVRLTLIPWENFDPKSATGNLKTAVSELRDIFGFKEDSDTSVDSSSLKGVGNNILGFASTVMKMGKTFVEMGTILFATVVMDIVKKALEPWMNFDASTSITNISNAVFGLKQAFGLDDRKDKDPVVQGLNQATGFISDYFALGSALLQSGKIFFEMGTILMATAIMGKIIDTLKSWENFDPTKSITNIQSAIRQLKDVFGLHKSIKEEVDENEDGKSQGGIWDYIAGAASNLVETVTAPLRAAGSLVQMGANLAEMGKTWATLGNLVSATGMMYTVLGSIKPWEKFDPSKSIENIQSAITQIHTLLMVNSELYDDDSIEKLEDFADSFKDIMDDLKDGTDGADKVVNGLNMIHNSLSRWTKEIIPNAWYVNKSIRWISEAFDTITDVDVFEDKADIMSDLFETIADNKIEQEYSSIPIRGSVKAVNSIDIEKAKIMVAMFRSFAGIKDSSPFDVFDHAVDRFIEACNSMVDSVDNFNNPNGDLWDSIKQSMKPQQPAHTGDSVQVSNTVQLAEAIANALRRLPLRINGSDMDVNLVVNGSSGRSVTLTLQN